MGWMQGLKQGLAATALFFTVSQSDGLPARDCTSPSVMPQYYVDTVYPDEEKIRGILESLEKVPDPIQRATNELGYRVVIVNGQQDMSRLQSLSRSPDGRHVSWPTEAEYEVSRQGREPSVLENRERHTLGFYNPVLKLVVVPQNLDSDTPGRVASHEYGHSIDSATGPSKTKEFLTVYEQSMERGTEVSKLRSKLMARYDEIRDLQRQMRITNVPSKYADTVDAYQYLLEPEDRMSEREIDLVRADWRNSIGYHEISDPEEFFAGVFLEYYGSRESRQSLRTVYPEAYYFMRQWEQMHAPGCQ